MSKSGLSPDRIFTSEGFEFDLEEIAEAIIRTDWPEGAKSCVITDKHGATRELSPGAALRDSIFGGVARSEGALNSRLALTRYFLQTGRPLLPEMTELLVEGITEHMKHSTPWKRPNLKPSTDYYQQCFVIALDNKFPRKRKVIGAALHITPEGVKKQLELARENRSTHHWATRIEMYLPENIIDSIELMTNLERRDRFLNEIGRKVI